VRAMIFHRGREMAHQEVGRAKMTRLLGEIGDQGQIETMRGWKETSWCVVGAEEGRRRTGEGVTGFRKNGRI